MKRPWLSTRHPTELQALCALMRACCACRHACAVCARARKTEWKNRTSAAFEATSWRGLPVKALLQAGAIVHQLPGCRASFTGALSHRQLRVCDSWLQCAHESHWQVHALAEIRHIRERSVSIDTVYDSSASLRHRAGRSREILDADYQDFAKNLNTGLFFVASHKGNQVDSSAFSSWCIFGDLFGKFFAFSAGPAL